MRRSGDETSIGGDGMSARFPVGKSGQQAVEMDLDKFVAHRLLIQASSGGGKSYLLRVLAEQLGPKIQIILLDPEGEFSSLREKLDMVLVAPDGEVRPDPKNAAALGRKLVELRTSAVCDLYELDKPDRRAFVRRFLDAVMAVPRKLYHPMVIAIDEAHDFCPERSHGQAESTASVINLLSKGRKRGFCGVLATQRLSKIHKDAAAECGNLLIGRTSPVDQKRAADLLGIPQSERHALARMKVGEWVGYGPAIGDGELVRFVASRATTNHPKAGSGRTTEPPAASAAIRKVAGKLAELARKDEDPITLDEANRTIAGLRKELRDSLRTNGRPSTEVEAELRGLRAAVKERDQIIAKAKVTLDRIAAACATDIQTPEPVTTAARTTGASVLPERAKQRTAIASSPRRATYDGGASAVKLAKAERLILTDLVHHPDGRSRRQLALVTGYSAKGGSFNNSISSLRTKGLAEGTPDCLRATTDGIAAVGDVDPLPRGEALLEHWKRHSKIGKAERLILDVLAEAYPEAMERDDLAAATGYAANGGSFGNSLSRLRTLGLIFGSRELRASDAFFEDGER